VVSITPLPLYPRERAPGTHFIGGWVDPRAGLDDMEKWKFLNLSGLELPPPGRPARSQSLYRLSYRGSQVVIICRRTSVAVSGSASAVYIDIRAYYLYELLWDLRRAEPFTLLWYHRIRIPQNCDHGWRTKSHENSHLTQVQESGLISAGPRRGSSLQTNSWHCGFSTRGMPLSQEKKCFRRAGIPGSYVH
jgi:hypothetical protein